MKYFLLLGIFLVSPALLAEIIKSKIHAVDDGMIKFENGRVAFLDKVNPEVFPSELIEAQIDERSSLVNFKRLPDENFKIMNFRSGETARPLFEPTVVAGMDEAWNIFNRSNHNYKRVSECSDRAHIWAHEEFKRSGTKSMKAFVFFTASYINSVRFKWWFHVAPMYKVRHGNQVEDYVMDYMYSDRPQKVKEWTDSFVYTKRPCKVTNKFSEYDVNPQTESCYLIFESMHYRLPGEIFDQERLGTYKNETTESELKASYGFAFN